MEHSILKNAFKSNRAEELGLDVWKDFVVPLFYNDMDLSEAKKTRKIIGGRGSGKTMLLRYLSHHSQFSVNKDSGEKYAINSIGLYWRADTNFLTMLIGQGVEENVWVKLFRQYMMLTICLEILSSLRTIADSNYVGITDSDLKNLNFVDLKDYDEDFPSAYSDLSRYFRKRLRECESAASNPSEIESLRFLPHSFLVSGFIESIKNSSPVFSDIGFLLFVDEYENLLNYQQKVINTEIKHSKFPLIYHVAMKKNGMATSETLGAESIQGIADYRVIDLDGLLLSSSFDVFSAELFLNRVFSDFDGGLLEGFNSNLIKDTSSVATRLSPQYRQSLLDIMREILPGMDYEQMAVAVLKSESHLGKLKRDIDQELSKFGSLDFSSDDFLAKGFEKGSIIVPALLSRKSSNPDEIYREFQRYKAREPSRFDGWIQNNFVGCYLQMYRAYDRLCPFYAGFDTYVTMARGNIRHFYELCNAAMSRSDFSERKPVISIEAQILGARSASEDILNEAPTYGRLGSKIRAFIYNLGHIFEFSHMRKTQSESEVNHFSIKGGFSSLDEEDTIFLSEAVKWGVVYQDKSTKNKDRSNPDNSDWVLNPIYAPFFFISYRKKRKIEISPSDFRILHSGSPDRRIDLEVLYKTKWQLEDGDQPYSHTLF